MKTQNIIRCIMFFIVFAPILSLSARSNTPVETFMRHIKENNVLMPMNNIWQADKTFDKTALRTKVEDAQPLIIDYAQVAILIKQHNTAISLSVPGTDGKIYTIELGQYNYLGNDFQVHVVGKQNSDIAFDYTPGLYYSGVVEGVPGSVAAFSFFNNEVYGIFSIPGVGNFNVVPNTMAGKYYDYNKHYLLYNDNDLKIKALAPGCATDDLPVPNKAAQKTTTTLNNDVLNNCTEVKVFEVGDYANYLTKGSSVTNVTNYLTALFNNQATLYRNEGVPIELNYVQVNSTTDAYQSITVAYSPYFLHKFAYVTQGTMHGCDLALLLGSDLNAGFGQMGGVAFLQAMCTSYIDSTGPYGFCNIDNSGVTNFPTYSWDVVAATHEMGHIVGSPHTHRCCWNPAGTGTTAIDGCYSLEGTCAMPSPALPVGGGTIMSYCHLTSDGINFSNGFGPQPGDTVRYYLAHHFSSTCGVHYNPTILPTNANRILMANRECTDIEGTDTITYYWNDNNTASWADDTLVLALQKHGNKIGSLDSVGFSVKGGALTGYGTGSGQFVSFPAGTPGLQNVNVAMHRYWDITATIPAAWPVEVMFPFALADTVDVDGSVPGPVPLASYMMYKVNSPVNPNPAIDSFQYTTPSNISLYTYGATVSAANWSLSTVGNTNFAHILTSNLSGGGSGFYTFHSTVGVPAVNTANSEIYVYPNPTHDQWYVSVAKGNGSNEGLTFELYTADGRLAQSKILVNGTINTINAADLPAGIYFYRVTGGSSPYSGNLLKK